LSEAPSLSRRLYGGWLEIAARFGEAQTEIIVALIYTFVIGVAAVAIKIGRGDPLHKRGLRVAGSAWNDAESTNAPDLERAKRLF
jgi:hypothetical protein